MSVVDELGLIEQVSRKTPDTSVIAGEALALARKWGVADRDVVFDMRPFLIDVRMTDEGVFRARLKVTPEGSARPDEVLASLGIRDLLDDGAVLVRTHVELAP